MPLFAFRAYELVEQLQMWVNTMGDKVVVGRYLSMQDTGTYAFAINIMTICTTVLVGPLGAISYPLLCRFSHDRDELRRLVVEGTRMTCMITVPASVGLCCIAPLLVPTVFGAKWLPLVPVLQILALWPGLTPTLLLFPHAYKAINRPDITPKIEMCVLAYSVPAYLIGAHFGLIPFAFAKATLALCLVPYALVLGSVLTMRAGFFLDAMKRPALAAGVMAAVVYPLTLLSAQCQGTALRVLLLLGVVAAGVLVYLGTLLVLDYDGVRRTIRIGRRMVVS